MEETASDSGISRPAATAQRRWTGWIEPSSFVLLGAVWLASLGTGLGLSDAWRGRLSWCALLVGALSLLVTAAKRRWLDGPRLLLVALALWSFADVYARVGGDGIEYYVPLRSILLDHDLAFANDFAGLGAAPVTTRTGEVTTRFPVGLALLWAPHFVLAHALALLARWCGGATPADGFAPIYQLAVTRASFLYGLAGLLLVEALLRRLYGRGVALLSTLGIWLATPLHFYMEVNPAMSHAASAFAASCLLVTWWRARGSVRLAPWLWVGCCGGVLALVRVQDALLMVLPLLDLLFRERRRALRPAALLLAGPAVAAILQTLFWLALYGPGFAGIVLRQGRVARVAPQIVDFLFAARHGLFVWTPLYVVAALGWLLFVRRERLLGGLIVLGFALAVVLNSAHGDWWGSDSFGQRRMLGLTPLFALGLAEALALACRRPLVPLAGLIAGLAFWTLQFEYVFNSGTVADKTQAVTLDRLVVAQADASIHDLLRAERWLPSRLFVLLYDNLKGVWLDEGSRSLGGLIDLGNESQDFPTVIARQWYGPEKDGEQTFRRPRGRRASLRVPIRTVGEFDVTLRARQMFVELPVRVNLLVNGIDVGGAQLASDWREYQLDVPPSTLRSGFNEVALSFSAAPRADLPGYQGKNAAAAVDWLRFARRGPAPDAPPSAR
jgi:hypothetical protein